MPLYDYQCDQCGHRFEVRQGIKEDPLTECPQCGSPIRRVIHPVGIVFKGSGFYVTDSRSTSSAATASNGDGAGGDKAEKADKAATPADNKPAATANGKTAAAKEPVAAAAGSSSEGSTTSS